VSVSASCHNAAATRCRVLVVEDDAASRRALSSLLRLRGFECVTAASVAEAMDRLAWGPTCLLLDLMLPDGNGAKLLEHIRANDLSIRVAVTTGASNWESMLDVKRLRPDAFFPKPVDFNRLVTWLNQTEIP
jgi:two-component system response regulator AtoC